MEYQTRNMIAVRPLRYDRVEVAPGELFVASRVDAAYLTRHGKAAYAPASDVASAPQLVQATTMSDPKPVFVEAQPAGDPEVAVPEPEPADPPPAAPASKRAYVRRTPPKAEAS